jgi:hypothetical protein
LPIVPIAPDAGRRQVLGTALSSLLTLPLACASFLFFHAVRRSLLRLRMLRDRGQESLGWRSMSEIIDQPLALPYIMVTGPRWNPHAIIASVGPFQVKEHLRLHVDTMKRSAGMWTLVLYSVPASRTVVAIDSRHISPDADWFKQTLSPGRYSGILRYYEWSAEPKLPAIEIDGIPRIFERSLPINENDYLERLRNKGGAFYTILHFYMLEMLRLHRYLPASFVRREYLPVGNPETVFRYGYLRRGQGVEITSSKTTRDQDYLYLVLYNESSFPVSWSTVDSLPHRTQPAPSTGSYLIRLHTSDAALAPSTWPDHLHVSP